MSVEEIEKQVASAKEEGEQPPQQEDATPGDASGEGADAGGAVAAAPSPEGTDVSVEQVSEEPPKTADAEVKPEEVASTLPWYVVHTYSGFELRVKSSLEERIRSLGLQDSFGAIMVPQETVVELVRGEKKTSSRKFLPGYILVQIDLDDETWHVVNETPKVTGFVGDSRNPAPLSEDEVKSLVQHIEGNAERPRPKVQFEEGDPIKVIDGPFTDFNGTVEEVKPEKGKVRVLLSIFGRNTPVELDFVQVEKT